MNIKSYTRGRTVKTVVVDGIEPTDSKDDIRNFAYVAAGETRESTFGTHIMEPPFSPGVAIVEIYID